MDAETIGTVIGAVITAVLGQFVIQERRQRQNEPKMNARDRNIEEVHDDTQTLRHRIEDLEADMRGARREIVGLSKRLDRVLTLWSGYMAAKGETLPGELIRFNDEDGE